jgi:hypothetical protein
MKWTNKGRQFDELGAVFMQNNRIVLIGSREDNINLYTKLSFLDVNITLYSVPYDPAFINRLSADQNALTEFLRSKSLDTPGKTVVINYPNPSHVHEFIDVFTKTGKYQKNMNVFPVNDFMGYSGYGYISIFSVYVKNIVYFPHICAVITTVCNLNCKYCLNFQAFIKNQNHGNLEEIKKDIDILFSHVDRIGRFHVSGGEPLLHPQLDEIVYYIHTRYGDRIECLMMTTNGKVIPSDHLCQVFRDCHCEIWPDNYLDGNPSLRPTYDQLIARIQKYGVYRQAFGEKEFFIKIFPPSRSCSGDGKVALIAKFNECADHWRGVTLLHGQIRGCLYVSFAVTAGLVTEEESAGEFLDLNELGDSPIDKRTIVEYRLGYSDKGYNEFCKWCDGRELADKTEKVPAGTQETSWLEWDRRNPTVVKEHKK